MIRNLDEYNPTKRKYKIQKENTLPNAKDFYSEKRKIIIGFENDIYIHCQKHKF